MSLMKEHKFKPKVRKGKVYTEKDVPLPLTEGVTRYPICSACQAVFEVGDRIYLYGYKEDSGTWVCYRHYGEDLPWEINLAQYTGVDSEVRLYESLRT